MFVQTLLCDTLGPRHAGGLETPKEPAPLHLLGSVVRTPDAGTVLGTGDSGVQALPSASSASCSANRQTKASTQDSLVAQRLKVSLAVQGARVRSPGQDDPTHCDRRTATDAPEPAL